MNVSPIEFTKRYATTVETLADAWQFVMAYLDDVGDDPSITIRPMWRIEPSLPGDDPDEDRSTRFFEVVVEGMRETE